MTTRLTHSPLLTAAALLIAGLLVSGSAFSAGTKTSEAQLGFIQERARCMSGESNQDRATCLKEAGAALQESRNRAASSGDGDIARNRLKRCDSLPGQDREDCAARMNEGTTTGSAQQGGVLRELSGPATKE